MNSTPASTPAVTMERDGHVLLMGLNRPAKRNAFTKQMLSELPAAHGLLESDDNLWCAVLFAHGDHFTGGLDMLDVGAELAAGPSSLHAPAAREDGEAHDARRSWQTVGRSVSDGGRDACPSVASVGRQWAMR
ncbi:hypothetical protein JS756_24255 [Streptomyces actuosus]|uniref:Enoyl-CoA hydratase n=1 Tax=Streptomyces actuosus TaxID=1885 RepID=A0ABS2VVJ9_STRAS|nr:enoyl-CoA hydratase-related protein [Streptomyces actuosus]MBN0047163.1 hypothetical protein [Streptomyces actuosus]